MIRCARPETKLVACEPSGAALLDGKEWTPHKIPGWTPDFIPSVLDRDIYDEVITVADDRAIASARDLAKKEGILGGISAGGTFAAALEIAAKAEKGSIFGAMFAPKPFDVAKEMVRVTRPGGRIVQVMVRSARMEAPPGGVIAFQARFVEAMCACHEPGVTSTHCKNTQREPDLSDAWRVAFACGLRILTACGAVEALRF